MPRWNTRTHTTPKQATKRPSKPCKGCGKPVRRTINALGYCKSCIRLASQESYKQYMEQQ